MGFAEKIKGINDKIKSVYSGNSSARWSRMLAPLIFSIVFGTFYWYIGVFKYIENRPSSLHISAQCQRASIALNYYEGSMNFFEPQIQRQLDTDGIAGVEFPIIYYTGAILYKLFGFNEAYLRGVSLAVVTLGFYLIFLFANRFLKNSLVSAMAILAGVVSPVLMFYTPNFMPDAPGIGFQFMAWYFLWRYMESRHTRDLNLFAITGTLGALLKATSAIMFAVVICLLILDKLKFFRNENGPHRFPEPRKILGRMGVGIAVVIVWYVYAKWLSKHHHNEAFALEPMLVTEWNVALSVFDTIKNLWSKHYFAYESYVLFSASFIAILVFFKYANRLLWSITMLYFFGLLCYAYLFFYQFKWHDYYFIALIPLAVFLVITFLEMVMRFSRTYFVLTEITLIVVLFFNVKESLIFCKRNYHMRYSKEMYYWTGDYRAYEDLEPKLRAKGIKRTDKVLSLFDDSYCSSLYLMNQIGINHENEAPPENIKIYLANPNIKYLVVNDSVRFNKYYPNTLQKNIVVTHRGLIVYKIR